MNVGVCNHSMTTVMKMMWMMMISVCRASSAHPAAPAARLVLSAGGVGVKVSGWNSRLMSQKEGEQGRLRIWNCISQNC